MKPGDSYYILDHLWIVVSHPAADGSVAMVNFTTHRPPCDETCVVNVGEHPFIKHKTIVAYGFARMVPARAHADVKKQPSGAPVGQKLLERILRAASQSLATPPKVLAAMEATLAALTKP